MTLLQTHGGLQREREREREGGGGGGEKEGEGEGGREGGRGAASYVLLGTLNRYMQSWSIKAAVCGAVLAS